MFPWQLNAAFGAGYEIYQNDVEQGLKEPCFLIAVLTDPDISPVAWADRFMKRNPLDIQYFPHQRAEQRGDCSRRLSGDDDGMPWSSSRFPDAVMCFTEPA